MHHAFFFAFLDRRFSPGSFLSASAKRLWANSLGLRSAGIGFLIFFISFPLLLAQSPIPSQIIEKKVHSKESSNVRIQDAINNPDNYIIDCLADQSLGDRYRYPSSPMEYKVTFVSNLGRIGLAAREAYERFEPFDLDDVDPALYKPSMFLLVQPSGWKASEALHTGKIKHVIIRRRKTQREDIAQPKSVDLSPETYSNLFGAQFTINSAYAEFDHRDVLDIASRGDVAAVVITTKGQYRCWVDNTRIIRMFE